MNLKSLLTVTAILVSSGFASAGDVLVNGYYKSNGTYVEPYHRTTPDNTLSNNYSTRGNVNPYTGQAGTVNPNYQTTNPYSTRSATGFNNFRQ